VADFCFDYDELSTPDKRQCLKNKRSLLTEGLHMVKVKVDPVHAMKACGGVEVKHHMFLISAIDVGWWTASCLSCFTAK